MLQADGRDARGVGKARLDDVPGAPAVGVGSLEAVKRQSVARQRAEVGSGPTGWNSTWGPIGSDAMATPAESSRWESSAASSAATSAASVSRSRRRANR